MHVSKSQAWHWLEVSPLAIDHKLPCDSREVVRPRSVVHEVPRDALLVHFVYISLGLGLALLQHALHQVEASDLDLRQQVHSLLFALAVELVLASVFVVPLESSDGL
jgi:hypothetical protein